MFRATSRVKRRWRRRRRGRRWRRRRRRKRRWKLEVGSWKFGRRHLISHFLDLKHKRGFIGPVLTIITIAIGPGEKVQIIISSSSSLFSFHSLYSLFPFLFLYFILSFCLPRSRSCKLKTSLLLHFTLYAYLYLPR